MSFVFNFDLLNSDLHLASQVKAYEYRLVNFFEVKRFSRKCVNSSFFCFEKLFINIEGPEP